MTLRLTVQVGPLGPEQQADVAGGGGPQPQGGRTTLPGRAEFRADGGAVPASSPTWVPATIVVWVVASLVGHFLTVGLGSVNSLLVGFLLYVVVGKAGLLREVGTSRTTDGEVTATPADATGVRA